MTNQHVDIQENRILEQSPDLLNILLKDHTLSTDECQVNIFWATDNYADRGAGYQYNDKITIEAITGANGNVIVPRAVKSRQQQRLRSREMAEVFTPSWICNKQCNLIDEVWFKRKDVFNTEIDRPESTPTWKPTEGKIEFPKGKTWRDYANDNRLEITCGEAPYLASRYDAVTGEPIPVERRIGLLDRKLRVVGENTLTPDEWIDAAKAALRSTYGYEWQGDNLLLARENLLFTMLEFYHAKFGGDMPKQLLPDIAYIISWNIWQMDGLKCVIPGSCHDETIVNYTLLGEEEKIVKPCPGCKKRDMHRHNGIYCKIMDWEIGQPILFSSLIKKESK